MPGHPNYVGINSRLIARGEGEGRVREGLVLGGRGGEVEEGGVDEGEERNLTQATRGKLWKDKRQREDVFG
jgi:hypothetical protein